MMIERKEIYTTGNSFRAVAEAKARDYRKAILKLPFGDYGHFLTDLDAQKGMNFLPSMRDSILNEVKLRDSLGK
jgi:hypothetical protein